MSARARTQHNRERNDAATVPARVGGDVGVVVCCVCSPMNVCGVSCADTINSFASKSSSTRLTKVRCADSFLRFTRLHTPLAAACLRGDRVYYASETFIIVIDTTLCVQRKLTDCGASFESFSIRFDAQTSFSSGFRPLNIHANYGMVAACGNGDEVHMVDAYTGELLFHYRRTNAYHLTNAVRIFKPNVPADVRGLACLADYDAAAPADDANDAAAALDAVKAVKADALQVRYVSVALVCASMC